MIRTSLVALVMLAAAGCSEPPSEQIAAPAEPVGAAPRNADEATAQNTCGAAAYHAVIGTPASALDVQPGARLIRPETAVTDDFVPERLNFIVNAEGLVTDLRCH